jgi:hypothetical protein
MNPHLPSNPWTRLVVAARQVPDERDSAAPYGFATRVSALALAPGRPSSALFERFALRAVGVAALLAIGSIAVNYSSITMETTTPTFTVPNETEAAAFAPADDPVAMLLDT